MQGKSVFDVLSRQWKCVSMVVLVMLVMLSRTAFAETLEDAWDTALSVNHRLQANRKNTESSRQTLAAVKAARFPTLTFESGYTILNNTPAAAVDEQGFPIKEISTSEDESFSYKTAFTLPLFTGGRISRNIDAAGSGMNSAVQDEIKAVLDLKLSVAEEYVSVLRSKQAVEVAESNVANLSSHVRDVASLYAQGMVTKNELLAAQVSLADSRQRLTQALNNLNLANASYNRLLGRPLDHEVRIDDLFAEQVKTDITELTSKAFNRRPELVSLSEQTQALRHQAAGVRASTMPQIELSGGYSYQQNKFQVHEDVWSATMGLKWELFDGGMSRHNAAALLQKADALSDIRTDTASLIALQVRRACLDIEESSKRIEVTREAVTQSEENLRVVKDRYREGVGTNTEVLDAETLRIKSRSNHDNAVYDAVMAKIRLRYAIGDL